MESEDVRYVFAGYRKGALASMGAAFADGRMQAAEFKAAFETEVLNTYDAAWTLFAETALGYRPVGFVLGHWPMKNVDHAPFMIVGDMVWFPWASARNRIAAAVNFFNVMRDEVPMMDYARLKDREFFLVICRHGIMRQVGTSQNVYPGQPAAVYETRRRVAATSAGRGGQA